MSDADEIFYTKMRSLGLYRRQQIADWTIRCEFSYIRTPLLWYAPTYPVPILDVQVTNFLITNGR